MTKDKNLIDILKGANRKLRQTSNLPLDSLQSRYTRNEQTIQNGHYFNLNFNSSLEPYLNDIQQEILTQLIVMFWCGKRTDLPVAILAELGK